MRNQDYTSDTEMSNKVLFKRSISFLVDSMVIFPPAISAPDDVGVVHVGLYMRLMRVGEKIDSVFILQGNQFHITRDQFVIGDLV